MLRAGEGDKYLCSQKMLVCWELKGWACYGWKEEKEFWRRSVEMKNKGCLIDQAWNC